MRKPLLIVIANFHPAVGGAERQAGRLARAFARFGRPAEVLTCSMPGTPGFEIVDGVPVHRAIRLVRLPGLWGLTHAAGARRFLARTRDRWDGLLSFQLHAFHNPAVLGWHRATGRPALVRASGGGDDGDLAQLARMPSGRRLLASVRRFPAAVALSDDLRSRMEAAGIDPSRVVVIPNGVETDRFRPGPGGARAPETIVNVGRLAPRKGVADLLDAFACIAPDYPGAALEVVGDGPARAALEARAKQLGLGGRVRFAGQVADVPGLLAAAGLVALPSLGEGMSNVLLEAMSSGCAIVASDIPPNRGTIEHGASGLLVPPRDPRALAGALRLLLRNPELARRFGVEARRRAVARFSIESAANSYLALFRRLAKEGRP